MKLWEVKVSDGVWIVRAETGEEAISVSQSYVGPQGWLTGWEPDGFDRDEVSVAELPHEGEPAVISGFHQ